MINEEFKILSFDSLPSSVVFISVNVRFAD